MSQHRGTRVATVNDPAATTADAAFAMALLWAIPAMAFLLMLTRL